MSRNALVTGAARGIGRAIALRLAKDGLNVAVNDLNVNSAELNNTQKAIEEIGRKSFAIIADVSNDKQVESMMKSVADQMGSLDVAIANAGIVQIKALVEITAEDWDKIFATNVRGMFLCYKEAAKVMIEQGRGGKIIGACSGVGHKAFPLFSHYVASKWSIRGLTQAAAMELAQYKITVNAYCPGVIDTPLMDSAAEQFKKYQNKTKDEMMADYLKIIALGRTGVPEDVANFVSFLASKDSDYMTGQSVIVDGGMVFS